MKRDFLSERVKSVPRVVSRAVDEVASDLKDRGMDVLSLSGAPISPPAEHVLSAAREAVAEGVGPPSRGILELREAIARKLKNENGITADPRTEILVTNGGMQALYITMTTLLNPGDEVLMFSPSFFFDGIVQLVGAIPVYVPTNEEEDFRFDIRGLIESISDRTKMIIVNTPANPTGYVATEEDLGEIADLAEKHGLFIVSDESYEKQVYDGRKHHSIGSLPGTMERMATIHSFTKSYAMPNWRVRFIAAGKDIVDGLTKTHEWMLLCCNYVAQKAATAALTGPQGWVREILHTFQKRRNQVCEGMAKIEEVWCVKPQGGAFIFLNISRLSMEPEELSQYLIKEFGIPAHAGLAFRSNHHIRIPFGATKKTLEKLLQRLERAVKQIQIKIH